MTKRITYQGVRVEIWQGNDLEGKLGYDPWFFRLITEPWASRIPNRLAPYTNRDAAIEAAKYIVYKAKERSI